MEQYTCWKNLVPSTGGLGSYHGRSSCFKILSTSWCGKIIYGFALSSIVGQVTKSAHFPARSREECTETEKLARIYINEIVTKHGVPVSIISDRDGRFASHFWQVLQKVLGTQVFMSTGISIQRRDGQSDAYHSNIGRHVAACVMDFGGIWNSPYRKLARPRFVAIRDYRAHPSSVHIVLRLPQELSCIHDVFHVSNLKKCLAESDIQIPLEEIRVNDKVYFIEEPVEIVDRQIKKLKRSWIPISSKSVGTLAVVMNSLGNENTFKAKYSSSIRTCSIKSRLRLNREGPSSFGRVDCRIVFSEG
ncbi:putative reverse transcriptase domain-containing protein [Tanacetum coccineum]